MRSRTQGEELGPEAPPTVQGEQDVWGSCLWIGGCLWIDIDVCTGQVRGHQKERDPFSSKKVEDGQDSSKARNGNEEIT